MSLVAEFTSSRHFIVRDEGGKYIVGLTFRDLLGLHACARGRVRWRLRGRYTPYLSHYRLEPECDDYGISFGTIYHLMHPVALIAKPEEEAPGELTDLGRAVLDAVLALPGVKVPA